MTQVWIAAPREWEDASSPRADPRQKAVLSEAIAAGKRNGIAVLAIARVSSMPKPDRPAADMDINLFGETETAAVKRALDQAVALGRVTAPFEKNLSDSRDWLIPDAPETVPRIARRLAELAAVPGLAGIVLADAVAPGYRSAEGTDQGNNDEPLGYTMARRIAFVRATGCDPIDITPDHNYGSAIVTPPFFGRTAPSPLAAWMTFRYQAAKRMLGALFPACHPMTAAPGFTVYMESIMEWERGRWYSVWQNPAAPPRAHVGQGDVIDVVTRSIHSDSKRSLYAVRGHDASYTKVASSNDDPPLPSSTVFAHDYQVSSYFVKRFDGCVFDFRDMPLARALDLLTAIPPATAPPPGR